MNDLLIFVGGSINGDTPKCMVYKGNPIKMDDLGVPEFVETIYCSKSDVQFHMSQTSIVLRP